MHTYSARLVALCTLLAVCVKVGNAVLCWECNSKHDPRCGGELFADSSLGVVDCSQLERRNMEGQEARFCRKIVQDILGEVRTIRGCGWLEDLRAKTNCYSRTGTKDIKVTFCQCEGNMCNSTSAIKGSALSLIVVLLISKFF